MVKVLFFKSKKKIYYDMLMTQKITSRTIYYRNYYLQKKEIFKFNYYEKKLRELERKELYEPYGGERAFYENYYKNWINENKDKDKDKE
jgi:hypothetical protein